VRVPLFLARRFLAGRARLLGTVATLALFGVALGAASLVVAMGLMSGYRHELQDKLAGTNAEVLVVPDSPDDDAGLRARLAKLPHVSAVARTAFAPGLVLSATVPGGVDVTVKGLELPAGVATTRLLASVPDLAAKLAPRPNQPLPALLGAGLARRLGLAAGSQAILETATLTLAKGVSPPRRTALTVAATVETGFSEVDDGWAVVALGELERIAPPDARRGLWELKLTKASLSGETVAAARGLLGPVATILDWKTLNKELFSALAIQQVLLFVVLALIVAVAAGTVVSSLVVLLAEKTREVGVLSALGATPTIVLRTFRLSGLLLGGGGLVIGILFGLLVCAGLTLTHAVRFSPEIARIYYLSWMPFRPEPLHVLGIFAVGMLLVLAASVLPARRASRLQPAEALRYE
jgi:lipoprotein-releasing system permease protein